MQKVLFTLASVKFNKAFFLLHNYVFAERGLEIGVLQDNADVLKSQNVSLNEEAQALSLQMTVSLKTL